MKDDKHLKFIDEYCISRNATDAYKKAYPDANHTTAKTNGYKVLNKPEVRAEIDRRLKESTEKAGVTTDMIIQELASIGFSRITDFVKVDDFEVITGYELDEDGNPDKDKPIKKTYRGVEVFKTNEVAKDKLRAVSEIKQDRNGISLKLYDKISALEKLGKNLGMFKDKTEHSGSIGIEIVDDIE